MIILMVMESMIAGSCGNHNPEAVRVEPRLLPPLPPAAGQQVQFGLAGPLAGRLGDLVMVAGGANFEDAMPWRGGTKSYHDEIYLLRKAGDQEVAWQQSLQRLTEPQAYAGCLSLEQGLLVIGGENDHGPVDRVSLYTYDGDSLRVTPFPALPEAITSPGVVHCGGRVYVVGGLTASGATPLLLSLDPARPEGGWQRLPDLPVALSHGVVVAQQDGTEECIYLLGGRNKTSEVHTFFSKIWKYVPSAASWQEEGEILSGGETLALSAGTGLACGNEMILLFGGDPGIYFRQTELLNNALAAASDSVRPRLLAEKDTLLTHHPGFSRDILAYHTLSRKWEKVGEAGEGLPVTTVAFQWNGMVLIPSGEIRPGVRTPVVTAFTVK